MRPTAAQVVVGCYALGVALAVSTHDALNGQGPDDGVGVSLSPALRSTQRRVPDTAKIVTLRWMDAGTDQPTGSEICPYDPVNCWGPHTFILDRDTPIGGINLEAIVQDASTIGSVQFHWQRAGWNYIENRAPYLMCGNAGTNVLPCQNLVPTDGLVVTLWSEPNGKGTKLDTREFQSSMALLVEPLYKYFTVLTPTLEIDDGDFEGGAVEISLSATPKVSFQANFQAYKQPTWSPKSVLFDLNNGELVRMDNKSPYTMLGNTGTTWYNTYTPALGKHKLVATAYREESGKGQSFNMTLDITVVE